MEKQKQIGFKDLLEGSQNRSRTRRFPKPERGKTLTGPAHMLRSCASMCAQRGQFAATRGLYESRRRRSHETKESLASTIAFSGPDHSLFVFSFLVRGFVSSFLLIFEFPDSKNTYI